MTNLILPVCDDLHVELWTPHLKIKLVMSLITRIQINCRLTAMILQNLESLQDMLFGAYTSSTSLPAASKNDSHCSVLTGK